MTPGRTEKPAAAAPATPPLVSSRLDLTPLRVADAEEMVDVLADPALYDVIGGEPPTVAALRERYRLQVRGHADGTETWHNWIVRLRSNGAAIGFVQATVTLRRSERAAAENREAAPENPEAAAESRAAAADIAWVIGTPWQGRGYAAEAAQALVAWLAASDAATSVTAHIASGHLASEAVARRAGLEPTDEVDDGEVLWRASLDRPPND